MDIEARRPLSAMRRRGQSVLLIWERWMRSGWVVLALLCVVIALIAGVVWLQQQRTEFRDSIVGIGATLFSGGMGQGAFWTDRALQRLNEENIAAAANDLATVEAELERAFDGAVLHTRALPNADFRLSGLARPISSYLILVGEMTLPLYEGEALDPEQVELLRDIRDDLRLIHETLPEELLREAEHATIERAACSLEAEIKVDFVREPSFLPC